MSATTHDDGTCSDEQHTAMRLPDHEGLVDHVDRNTLSPIDDITVRQSGPRCVDQLRTQALGDTLSFGWLPPCGGSASFREPDYLRARRVVAGMKRMALAPCVRWRLAESLPDDPWKQQMPKPQQLLDDVVDDGHAIPVARVQATHEGKRRTRARGSA
jgi:hypothetical protein